MQIGVIAAIAAGCAVAVGLVVSVILVRRWQRLAKREQDVEKGQAVSNAVKIMHANREVKTDPQGEKQLEPG